MSADRSVCQRLAARSISISRAVDEACAQEADEIAALELEDVAPRLGELVPFDVGGKIRRGGMMRRSAHFPPPVTAVTTRIRRAARRTALTIRGYVPQRQTLRSMS